jgi:hypothetical protein
MNTSLQHRDAVRDLVESLQAAVGRVEIANKEGSLILSAWLPGARAAIANAASLVQAPTAVPPGQEWWTQGLHGWHARALQAEAEAAALRASLASERQRNAELAALLHTRTAAA